MSKVEQLDSRSRGAGIKRWNKKRLRRLRRRAERRDPQNASARVRDYIRGYVS